MKASHLSLLLAAGFIFPACSSDYSTTETETSVSATYRGQLLWTYRHDPTEAKPCFHPLSSTDGTLFTDFRPEDHPWHRGLWFSWKYINGVNYWEENRKTGKAAGETRIVGFDSRITETDTIHFELDIEYGPADNNEVILTEQRHIVVSPPQEDGAYTIDWSATYKAVGSDVELDRTPPPGAPNGKAWGGYAGWSVRMNKDVHAGVFLNSEGEEGADRHPARWQLFKAPDQGCLLLMDHPQNLNYPVKWYIAPKMPYFSPALIHDHPHRLQKGQTLSLRYRLVVAPGKMTLARAEKWWESWTGNPTPDANP
jgi:hypothetical protein